MIVNFKFVRTLNFSNLSLIFRNPNTQKKIIDVAIFLSAGAILFSLLTAFLEVKIEKLREKLDNSQSNFSILRTVRLNTEADFLFKLTYLDSQNFNYGDFNQGSLLSGWESELKSKRRNSFFAFSRLDQANEMLIKLDLFSSTQATETLKKVEYFRGYRAQTELLIDDFLTKIGERNSAEGEQNNTKDSVWDIYNDAFDVTSEIFYKYNEYANFTYKNISNIMETEREKTLELRQHLKKLNWWSSNTFLIGFIAQLVIYLTFQLFELALERRKPNG
ncbi:hypothetical protein HIMB100_00006100 [SAR116 cluster alpha proteobacterium HIMB100]|nr:hypothetical protein HIMB100_00006100 [SAR116 cluster alpha proteobacterium HIMB100]